MADDDLSHITPEMAKQELAKRAAARQQPSSMLGNIGSSALGKGAESFLNAAIEPQNQLNIAALKLLGHPQAAAGLQQMFQQPQGGGIPGAIGQFAGNAAPFMTGMEGLEAGAASARVLPEGLGFLGKLLSQGGKAPAAGRAMLGSSGLGALQNPDNPQQGAALGMGLGAAGEAASPLASMLKQKYLDPIASMLSPNKYASKIANGLGLGRSPNENSISLAGNVKDSYDKHMSIARDLYAPVNEPEVANGKIYDFVNKENSKFINLPEIKVPGYSYKLKQLEEEYLKNPTFENAHDLQSTLGSEWRQLKKKHLKGELSAADKNVMDRYFDKRGALKNDTHAYLSAKHPNLSQSYSHATKYYDENLGPIIDNPNLSMIAKGEVKNPRNIGNIFKYPEEDMQKVVSDLGPDAKNKIIYSQLRKHYGKGSHKDLLEDVTNLRKNGFESYISPSLDRQLETLKAKSLMGTAAQTMGGAIGGGTLAHQLGSGIPGAEIAGAMAGSIPGILSALKAPRGIGAMAKNKSPEGLDLGSKIKRAFIANILASQNQGNR